MGPVAGWDETSRSAALAGRAASAGRHLSIAALVLVTLVAVGTAGYVALTEMSPFEALYMTVTTLSTVGFLEVRPLGTAGRAFTIGLILAGVGTALYTAGAFAEFLIAGRLGELLGRRAMTRTLAALHDHVIVCGYGRLGQTVCAELARSGTPFLVIEEDPVVAARLEGGVQPFLVASAADDEVLSRAGVARARALVAATGSEAVNVFVALAAREANARIAIHARAETEAGARRLRRAGATQVVSPHHLGGLRLANAILRPAVADFMELAAPGTGREIDLEEVVVGPGSGLEGARLGDLAGLGARVSVVALQHDGEPIRLTPEPDELLRAGDRVVVVGGREPVTRLAELASAGPRP